MLNLLPFEKLHFINNYKHAGTISCKSNNILCEPLAKTF